MSMTATEFLRRAARGAPCRWACAAAVLLAAVPARAADFQVLVSIDPSDNVRSVVTTAGPAASLGRLLGGRASMLVSNDLKDSLRASRTGENQAIVGPAHVTASALSHGYALAAVAGGNARYALVARTGIAAPADLRGKRLYLPQQDSLRSYIARGLLEQAGLSLRTFGKVEYRNTSGAGLIAVGLGVSDATVAEVGEAQAWLKANPGKAGILLTSQDVPGGLALVLHGGVPAADRDRILRWATEPGSPMADIAPFRRAGADVAQSYDYVASLGIVTPERLDGALLVDAARVQALLAAGQAVAVDTRSAREFMAERIPGAVHAAYGEKSLKERDYDAAVDDLSAIARLDRNRPAIFLCNGPECWKSYKASREALKMGFRTVYWFRGGMPAWRAAGLPVERGESVAQAEKR